MAREPSPISEVSTVVFLERLGWAVVAILLAVLVVGFGAWYGAMLDIRT